MLDPLITGWPGPWWRRTAGALGAQELLVDTASGARFTFAEVHALLLGLGGWLDDEGVPVGARVLLAPEPALDCALLAAALSWTGRVPCVLPPGLPPEAVGALAARLGAWAHRGHAVLTPPTVPDPGRALAALPSLPLASDAAVVLTSGSAGAAKAVRLSHGALLGSAVRIASRQDVSPRRFAVTMAMHTVTAGRWSLLIPALLGGTSVLVPSTASPREAFDAVRREGATVLITHPAMAAASLACGDELTGFLGGHVLPRLRVGGAPASAAQRVALARATGAVVSWNYGLSETAGMFCSAEAHPDGRCDPGVGRPMVPVTLLGEDGPVGPGEVGRVVVHAPEVYSGYVGGPDHVGPVVTEDLGRLDEEGFLHLLGRADRVLVDRAGNKTSLDEVEAALWEAGVTASVVAVAGEVYAAVVTTLDEDALRRGLAGRLPVRAWPRGWVRVAQLPTLPGGKRDLRAVVALVEASLGPPAPTRA